MPPENARRQHAEALRRQGLSFSEITAQTGVSQSTLSGWLRHIQLTPEQRARLEAKRRANEATFPERVRFQVEKNQQRYQAARDHATQAGATASLATESC